MFSRHRVRDYYRRFLRRIGARFTTVRVNSYRMKIDLNDNVISTWLFLYGQWEPYETELMSKLLCPGMTFVDVGAHIGYYSLLAAHVVGHSGRVLAFEPSPDNFTLLKENIRLNGLSETIHAENAALASQRGEIDLYLSTYNSGDHRIYPTTSDDDAIFNAGARRPSVRVPAITLDEYLNQQDISQIDVVKIDVQGAEMEVLLGMRETFLRSSQPLLFIEFWPHGLLRCGTEPQALLSFLADELSLSLLHILPQEQRVVPIEPISFTSRTQSVDPRQQIDLICCRSPHKMLEDISRWNYR